MAKKTYLELKQQIETLEAQAAEALKAEAAGVVERVKEAIRTYGLTAADLFGAAGKAARGKRAGTRGAKYMDSNGNTWGGRGPRPQWLREQIQAGRALEEFAVGPRPAFKADAVPSPSAPRKAAAKKRGGKVRFRDGEGNEWSGFGPQPKWLKAAIESGKTLEDFKA